MDDDMIACVERGEYKEKDCFLRARMNQNIFRLDGIIQSANSLTQRRTALRFGVSKPMRLKFLCCARLKRQQFSDSHRFAIRTAQQILRSEFVFGEVAFELERRKLHIF